LSSSGERLKTLCITVLGSGFMPIAPGTWGSAVAIALFAPVWLIAPWTMLPRTFVTAALVAGIVVASWLSIRWGGWAIARFGSADPHPFVLDEFAGQWVALLALPLWPGAGMRSVAVILAGQFFLFRVFDVIKPPPARQAERLPAGYGILIDDLFAGLYANLVGQLLWRLTPLAAWIAAWIPAG
jgi:phosphatidylglycerophosphatase A